MTPLSIYIHWPFCKSKCPYCDFNSHVRDVVEHVRWREALLRELRTYAEKLPGREVVSMFFGGGTPSLMQPETAAALIDTVRSLWPVSDTIEITLEANPTSVETESFKAFRKAGVNRASLGVQALNAEDLKFLGRQHSADEALAAVSLAHDIFPRVSFDLIYARPGQSLVAWEAELTRALPLTQGHISLYQLTIEENTAFHHAYHSGRFIMPEEGLAADMYELTQAITQSYGLPAYEISNHAALGEESRHNLAYWRGEDYIGIGPGAHGRYTLSGERYATETIKSPERWLEKVEACGTGLIADNILSPREHAEELVLMGLRLNAGIDYQAWQQRTGISLHDVLSAKAIDRLQERGMIAADANGISATHQGSLLLNRILTELLAQ